MTQLTVSRRLLVGGTSTALLLGVVGFVPLLGSASAACTPTYKDPAGDAVLVANGAAVPMGPDLGNDADLDILDVTHTVDAGVFRSIVHLAGLKAYGPQVSFMDTFQTHFTVNGKSVDVEVERDHNTDPETVTGLLTVGGTDTAVKVKGVVDLKASTVTAEIAVPAFEGALGGSLLGKPFSAMTATSIQVFEVLGFGGPRMNRSMDTATAPAAAAYAFGASCSGGSSAPAPSGSATPAPSGSATPAPSGSPSPAPSGSATPSPAPTSGVGADGLFLQPRKGCALFTDETGDADPSGTGFDQEDSLDVSRVNLKSPAGQLQVFVGLVDPAAAVSPPFSGRTYVVGFTANGKAVTLTATGDGAATATVAGAANSDIKATAKVDATNKNLVLTVPLEGLGKAVGATVTAGTAITGTNVTTKSSVPGLGARTADTAAGTKDSEKTYAYGDNSCFLPPPGKIAIDADSRGQYTDATVLFATLTDADDAPVAGATVVAGLTGGRTVAAVTDEEGVAEIALPVLVAAGSKVLTVAFAGTDAVGAVEATTPFTVVAEKVLLKAVGTRGGAQATLVDDDRRPVANQVVTFTIGGKRYAVRTNSRGVAVLNRIAKGTVVKIGYAGAKGYFLTTPTYTVKAL